MAKNDNNDEDVLAKLTKNMVIDKSLSILSLGYLISKRKLAYNKK